jgi:hypothetical protein
MGPLAIPWRVQQTIATREVYQFPPCIQQNALYPLKACRTVYRLIHFL